MNHSAQKRRKRPITVTVSGERGSGKTTLIAVVSAALENSGHHVQKDRFVPNATRAIADLHEQFDVTFVEQYDPQSTAVQMVHEAAQLRATIDELRGQVAGLSNENARLRESNVRYAEVDEKLRAEVQQGTLYSTNLLGEIENLKAALRAGIPSGEARRQIDMAFEEVRQAAYVEMERNRLRTQADELKQRARKLAQEGDARLDGARQRMMFALSGGTAMRIAEFEPIDAADEAPSSTYYGERIANPFSAADKRRALAAMERSVEEADYERPRTLAEQAQDIYGRTREASATDRLAAANIALMSDDDFSQDTGC